MSNAPIVSWYEGSQDVSNQVVSTVNYGTIDADSASPVKQFNIWNNRGGTEDCPKMEEVVFTTRDRAGGLGDTIGNEVEAVRDSWFFVRVDSMGETGFTPVGKGGVGTLNPSGTHPLGTTGMSVNINKSTAIAFTANTPLSIGTYVKPTVENGFIYKVNVAGLTDSAEPTWITSESSTFTNGTVEFQVVKVEKTPSTQEILGLANKTLPNGTNVAVAGGNFATVSVYAEVPVTAKAGKNLLVQRVSYRYV